MDDQVLADESAADLAHRLAPADIVDDPSQTCAGYMTSDLHSRWRRIESRRHRHHLDGLDLFLDAVIGTESVEQDRQIHLERFGPSVDRQRTSPRSVLFRPAAVALRDGRCGFIEQRHYPQIRFAADEGD